MIRSTLLLLLVAMSGSASGQCYRTYPSYSYYKAPPVYSYPYYNNSLNAHYVVNFPQPAAAGATSFSYQAQQYPFMDATLLLNSSARLVESAQSLSSRGLTEHLQAVTQIMGAQAQVAESQSQAASLAELARIAKETKPGTSATIARSTSGQLTVTRTLSGPAADRGQRIQQAFNEACVKCHSPGGEHAELDLRDLASLDEKWEPEIMKRILTDDPAKVMPPPRSGKVLPAAVIVDLIKSSTLLSRNGNGGNGDPEKLPPAKTNGPPPNPEPKQ